MAKVILSPKAEQDLEEIYEYTFNIWGDSQAERYQDELHHAMNLISENKEIGVLYPYAKIEYRYLHVNRHLIFYRMDKGDCLIVRILHDRMKLKDSIE